jgi:nucleotide-binding universal stress UspA family protein
MKLILCPTDFSKSSENAILYAAEIAKAYNSRIILMHSYDTPVIYTDVTISAIPIDYKFLQESALTKLKKFYLKLHPNMKGVHVEFIIQQGLPSSRTLEIAIEKKVDLIVSSSTSTNVLERFIIGSNTTRILKDAPCPIMVIPPKAKFNGLKKIIFTTDLTESNLHSAEKVTDIAKMFKSEVIFLNIDNQFLVHDTKDLERITARIKQFIKYPKMKGYVCTDINIADGITFFLKNEKADCLAMVMHHRKLLSSILNPSITKKVAYHPSVPLLIMHDEN